MRESSEKPQMRMTKNPYGYFVGIYALFIILFVQIAQGAPALRIVGSSAVFPFAATVGEHFSYKTHEPVPLVEAIGTGAGIKLFCGDVEGPDGVITSRPMTQKEINKCKENNIIFKKFTIGQDGLVLVQNNKDLPFSLSLAHLDYALSEKVPQGKECIKNPYKTWHQIHSLLPDYPIRFLGPSPTSGTYDILVEKIKSTCGSFIRRDGLYVEAPANENLIIQKVLNNRHMIGIVTFSFYEQNRQRLHALPLNNILPSISSIQDKSYALGRPLFLYIKVNDLENNPARRAYTLEFTSAEAIGDKGYLNKKGLIPLSREEQKIMQDRARQL